ncbi:ATP-binding protein [Rubrobacter taiwanensis]|uniref:ATP-binding protein n=1 Tax=Rubrobacter taiwanensis TaxID=185139 RepID=UPI001404898D|nr:ATP-binding protein [Rubrobacter taiwanensis]
MLHREFLDLDAGPVGRVVTSEEYPATAHEFYFWTAESEAARKLDIGHIVAAESEDATAVAVLDDPRRYSDLASFLDDFYARDGDAALEALSERVEILVFRARVLATRHRSGHGKSRRPVRSGPVYFATRSAIEFALGREDFSGTPIPMLLHENGNQAGGAPQRTPLYVDEDYLLGPEAGHMNITGMSGLSTKTSHALFTIASIFQNAGKKKVAALMFNVKGADLLFLDKPVEPPADDPALAARYEEAGVRGLSDEERRMYEDLGLRVEPFENLKIFAPLRPGMDPKEREVRVSEISPRRLNTLRNTPGESLCVYPIVWELGDVLPYAGYVFDPADYDDKFRGFVEYLRSQRVRTMSELFDEIDRAQEEMAEKEATGWRGHHTATIAKAYNRFSNLPSKCAGLLVHGRVEYGDAPRVDDPFEDREMRVVDISRLSGVPQDLIVTSVIRSIWEKAEKGELNVDKLIIFVDELNKYAPSGAKSSSLKDTLVDISARGRHLRLTLFGAQQFRSKVDEEVIGNAATSLYGRIGDEEITNASYRSFSQTTRDELLQLEKGRLLLRHAHYAVPVFGRFPRPPVLMGKQGTDIFGTKSGDLAEAVQSTLRGLNHRPPPLPKIREDIAGASEEQILELLDKISAVCRNGGTRDPYRMLKRELGRESGFGFGDSPFRRGFGPPEDDRGRG